MKRLLLLSLILLNPFFLFAQQNQWMWINGNDTINNFDSEFGLTGVEDSENWPSGLSSAGCVVDSEGLFWLFSGFRGIENGRSELWVYIPSSNNWVFKKGKYSSYNAGYSKGLNIEHYKNIPQDRKSTQIWSSNNYIYIFSGNSIATSVIQDFWRYNRLTNNWEQLNEIKSGAIGQFGIKGVESDTNIPPTIRDATTWTDKQGNLWMFGGYSANKYYNTLWKYNIVTRRWVWVSGSSSGNELGNYFALGKEHANNSPGARMSSNGWLDADGNLIIFGGYGTIGATIWGFNDIWKYNPVTNLWTWVKGSQTSVENISTTTSEDPGNMPSGVSDEDKSSSWKDLNGNFWLYEGSISDKLWKYNETTNNWALVKNILLPSSDGAPTYGNINIPEIQNTPGRRVLSGTWTGLDGNLYMYSGMEPYMDNSYNDLWKYDISTNQWTWIKGCSGFPGCSQKSKLISIPETENTPGLTSNYGAKWQDKDGNLWLYSTEGAVYSEGYTTHNTHLWKYYSNSNQWQWINGRIGYYPNPLPSYGIQGIENSNNIPGTRFGAMSWIDLQGNLWLFSGEIPYSNYVYNDLWKYNIPTNMWVWMGGSQSGNLNGVYGTQGVMDAGNWPGARVNAKTWTDKQGNFWLFGGKGFGKTGMNGDLNDLWKYNTTTNQWIWIKGSDIIGSSGFSSGVNSVNMQNSPVCGNLMGSWSDNNNNLWLYNGAIWKYDIIQNSWILIRIRNNNLIYGSLGIPDIKNLPGIRRKVSSWSDTDGNLWLFGGELYFVWPGEYLMLNDLWKYNIVSDMWSWMAGIQDYEAKANYGTINVASISNVPGSRINATSWADTNGKLYLFGGTGFDDYYRGNLNDIWVTNWKTSIAGIEENEIKADLIISPNPFKSTIYFNNINATRIELYDINGRKVKDSRITDNNINLSDIHNGIYLIKVFEGHRTQTTKICKE